MYWLESLDGVVLDADLGWQSLAARHKKHSSTKAKIFWLGDGIKKFIIDVN